MMRCGMARSVAVFVVCGVVACPAVLSASQGSVAPWYRPYKQGLDALKKAKVARDYEEAISFFERALTFDGREQSGKCYNLSGTDCIDYFPRRYIAQAREKLGGAGAAPPEPTARPEAGPPPRASPPTEPAGRSQAPAPSAPPVSRPPARVPPPSGSTASTPPPPGLTVSTPPPSVPPVSTPSPSVPPVSTPSPSVPPVSTPSPAFAAARLVADESRLSGSCREIQTKYEAAKREDPTAFDFFGLQSRLGAAIACVAGESAFAAGNWGEAKREFNRATAYDQQLAAATEGLRKATAAAASAVPAAAPAAGASASRLGSAPAVATPSEVPAPPIPASPGPTTGGFDAAPRSVSEGRNAEASDLAKRILARDPGHAGAAEIRQQAEPRLRRSESDELVARGLELARGVRALFAGDVDRSVDLLRRALEGASSADLRGRAALHGYLGVAYANSALTRSGKSALTFKGLALEQFRRALQMQPDYRLPDQLVSPRIVRLFDEVRPPS